MNWRTYSKKVLPESLPNMYRNVRAFFLSVGLSRKADFIQPTQESEASADVSIVMPVLDPPPLVRCLASVERYAPYAEVILVDDGSVKKETLEIIEDFRVRNEWKVIRNETATGHSHATEAGARLATRPYLCLLNSDTVITPWSWRAAREAFEVDANIAVTGPSTSHASTCQVIRTAELCRHYWNDSQVFGFAQKYVGSQPEQSWIDLPDVGGFALFIRRAVWEEFGGFDPNLPHYGNEVELCKRISKKGWRIIWTRNSYIHHLGGQSYASPSYGDEFINLSSQQAQDYIDHRSPAA